MDCRTPPLPEDDTVLDGYGDPKAKFQFTVPPPCMAEPREIPIPGTKEKQPKWDSPEQKAFVRQEMLRCYNDGYWCFIKGVRTWLPPWYYFFLNYWKVPSAKEDGRLEYRDSQRRVLLFLWNVIMFTRCMGVCYLKGRRNFATAIGHAIAYIESTRGKNRKAGLSSSDKTLSEENYLEMMAEPIKEMPLWLRPDVDVQAERVLFRNSKNKSRDPNVLNDDLNSDVTMKALTKRGFDGRLLHFLFGDESGKWTTVNVVKWIARQIKVMMAMGKRIGFAWMPTTAEEIEAGGKEFRKLFEDSDVETMKNGKYTHTKSHLLSLFIPAYDGWPGWIGPYGESIIEYPDDEQWAHMLAENPDAERIGSKAYLEREIQQVLEDGDDEAASLLRREAPFFPSDAWTGLNSNCPYSTVTTLQQLKVITDNHIKDWLMDGTMVRGFFDFPDKKNKDYTVFRRSDTGPVYITWTPPEETMNQVKYRGSMKLPVNSDYGLLYLDPYGKNFTKNKGSNMGLGGKRKFDRKYEMENRRFLDVHGRNMPGYFKTPAVFLYYAGKSIKSNFDFEQLHGACLYFSMPVALENNRSNDVESYMNQWGMRGFMLKEWEINGVKPTSVTQNIVGITTPPGETATEGPISMGADYHDAFIRGNSPFLGDFDYNILEHPLMYPFPWAIQDNLDMDMLDRTKSDYSMALNIGSFAEWNINRYDEYVGGMRVTGHKIRIPASKKVTYYKWAK